MIDSARTILSSIENSGWKKMITLKRNSKTWNKKINWISAAYNKKNEEKKFLFRVSFLKTKKLLRFCSAVASPWPGSKRCGLARSWLMDLCCWDVASHPRPRRTTASRPPRLQKVREAFLLKRLFPLCSFFSQKISGHFVKLGKRPQNLSDSGHCAR